LPPPESGSSLWSRPKSVKHPAAGRCHCGKLWHIATSEGIAEVGVGLGQRPPRDGARRRVGEGCLMGLAPSSIHRWIISAMSGGGSGTSRRPSGPARVPASRLQDGGCSGPPASRNGACSHVRIRGPGAVERQPAGLGDALVAARGWRSWGRRSPRGHRTSRRAWRRRRRRQHARRMIRPGSCARGENARREDQASLVPRGFHRGRTARAHGAGARTAEYAP